MIRCCLCRRPEYYPEDRLSLRTFERSDLPGSGWRCIDRTACRARVREIVSAHQGLGEVCR